MNLKKLVRCCKELNVAKIIDNTYVYSTCFPLWMRYIDHSVSDIVQMSINRRVEVGLVWDIKFTGSKELQGSFSSFKRLRITESILEEL